MRKLICFFITTFLIFSSCKKAETTEMFYISYDTPFPKSNKDLSKILGKKIALKYYDDTLFLSISSTKNNNLILNNLTGDTLFYGAVSRFRGLYYFSEQNIDGLYWIFAVKISGNLIYGFRENLLQAWDIKQSIKKGSCAKLIKSINADTSIVLFYANKREMKKLYTPILNNISADTILNIEEYVFRTKDTSSVVIPINNEDFNYILNVYPNPAAEDINIELQQKSPSSYQVSDLNGRILLEGNLFDLKNTVSIATLQSGVYMLTIINQAEKQKETIKLVKSQ